VDVERVFYCGRSLALKFTRHHIFFLNNKILRNFISPYNNSRHGRGRGRGNNHDQNDHLKNITCYNCDKKGHYSSYCKAPKKNGNENSNMVSKADFKNLFQSSIKEMLTKREKQKKEKDSTDMDEESLDINVFYMFTGKHD
jgi:hypothetical protein